MTTEYRYIKGVTLGPPIGLLWKDGLGAARDLNTGYGSWTVQIVPASSPLDLLRTKTVGITGYTAASSVASGYNLTIDWETADHADLPASLDGIKYFVNVFTTPSGLDAIEFPGLVHFVLEAPAVTPS